MYRRISVSLCVLLVLGGCRRSIDFSEHAKAVRKAKEEANYRPKADIDGQNRALRKQNLRPQIRAVREAELHQLGADPLHPGSIPEQQTAAHQSQMGIPSPASNSGASNSGASNSGHAESPPSDVTSDQLSQAQEIYERARTAQQSDTEMERYSRVYAFFEEISQTNEQQQAKELERAEDEQEARKHGVIELTHFEPEQSLEDFRFMFLRGEDITDDSLARLSGLSQLKLLHLDRVAVTESGLSHLEDLPNLRLLIIERVRLPEAVIAQLREKLRKTTIHYIPPPAEKKSKPPSE